MDLLPPKPRPKVPSRLLAVALLADMLREPGERLARLGGVEVKPIDLTDAPEELYAGCPY